MNGTDSEQMVLGREGALGQETQKEEGFEGFFLFWKERNCRQGGVGGCACQELEKM